MSNTKNENHTFENPFKIESIAPSALDTISITSSALASDTTFSTIDLSGMSYTAATTGTTYTLGAGGSHANAVWTTTGTGTGYNWSAVGAVGTQIDQGGKISLKGENADIDIDGKSLKAWMEKVEERLNILTPNPELEKEWDDLRRLGERYRKLEKKCKEKAEVWKKLKSMPPPNLD